MSESTTEAKPKSKTELAAEKLAVELTKVALANGASHAIVMLTVGSFDNPENAARAAYYVAHDGVSGLVIRGLSEVGRDVIARTSVNSANVTRKLDSQEVALPV